MSVALVSRLNTLSAKLKAARSNPAMSAIVDALQSEFDAALVEFSGQNDSIPADELAAKANRAAAETNGKRRKKQAQLRDLAEASAKVDKSASKAGNSDMAAALAAGAPNAFAALKAQKAAEKKQVQTVDEDGFDKCGDEDNAAFMALVEQGVRLILAVKQGDGSEKLYGIGTFDKFTVSDKSGGLGVAFRAPTVAVADGKGRHFTVRSYRPYVSVAKVKRGS